MRIGRGLGVLFGGGHSRVKERGGRQRRIPVISYILDNREKRVKGPDGWVRYDRNTDAGGLSGGNDCLDSGGSEG